MADYWKSNPRKFCEVCRCWFGDNKASVEFHERGRRHQENVKKMLSNARQRATENEKQSLQTREILASIETAAAAAYMKDLGGEAPADAKPSLPSAVTTPTVSALHPTLEENFQLRKAKAHAEILNAIQKRQAKSEREENMKPPPPPPSPWQQAATQDGQFYYYNVFTRETQWEQPETFQPLPPDQVPQKTTELKPPTIASNYTSTPSVAASVPDAGSRWEGERESRAGRKRGGEEGEGEGEPQPKRHVGPYGAWTTVAIRPREPDPEPPEKEKEEDDSESESEREAEGGRRLGDDEEEERLKFRERTVTSLGEGTGQEGAKVTPGSFKGFGFKKKSSGRPQIRQRTRELS